MALEHFKLRLSLKLDWRYNRFLHGPLSIIKISMNIPIRGYLTFLYHLGNAFINTCSSTFGTLLPSIYIFWRWHTNVGPMVGTKGIHGHFLGLWLVPCNLIRHNQFAWPGRRSCYGLATIEGRYCVWTSIRNCVFAGKIPQVTKEISTEKTKKSKNNGLYKGAVPKPNSFL